MRPLILFSLGLILVPISIGCNSDPMGQRSIALMKSELMDLEDKYYALKAQNQRIAERLGQYEDVQEISEIYWSDDGIYEVVSADGCEEIILDSVDETNLNSPETNPTPAENIDEQQQEQQQEDSSSSKQRNRIRRIERISQVTIHPTETAAHDVDGQSGDDGVQLLIQPKSSTGTTLLRSSPMTISLIDPTASPQNRQIGLWTFTAEEMKLFTRKSAKHNGYMLKLPWDIRPPAGERLLVSVRMINSDGRRLQASQEIPVSPPNPGYTPDAPAIAAWTADVTTKLSDRRSILSDPSGDSTRVRRGVRAIPAKSDRDPKLPEWRPIR